MSADAQQILDPNPGLRSVRQWQELLGGLVASLSACIGIDLTPTSWVVRDDEPDHACACNCVNVRGVVHAALRLEVCGAVCVTVNFGEAAWASCDLLLFAAGQRARGPGGLDIVFLQFSAAGWAGEGWVVDENGEWESHTTDEGWSEEG